MTETPGTYDVAPNRCHCDADWTMAYDDGWQIHCVKCGEWIMDFEAVARWNKQRAEIERLQAVLRDVESWTALDGDGISQPLLDRVRAAIGLSPYKRGDDSGAE